MSVAGDRKTIVALRRPAGSERSAFVDALLAAAARTGDRIEIELADDDDARLRPDLRKRSQPPGRSRFDAVVQWWHSPGGACPVADAGTIVATYEVDEVVHWADAVPVMGFTHLAFVCKQTQLTPAEFRARYLGHAALARPAHPKIVHYVQNFVTAHEGESPCDAISFLRFADYPSYRDHFFADDDHMRAVARDMSQTSSREEGWSIVAEPLGERGAADLSPC